MSSLFSNEEKILDSLTRISFRASILLCLLSIIFFIFITSVQASPLYSQLNKSTLISDNHIIYSDIIPVTPAVSPGDIFNLRLYIGTSQTYLEEGSSVIYLQSWGGTCVNAGYLFTQDELDILTNNSGVPILWNLPLQAVFNSNPVCAEVYDYDFGIYLAGGNITSYGSSSAETDIYGLISLNEPLPPVQVTDSILSSTAWMGGVYVVSGEVSIDSGVSLDLMPGTILKFDTSTTSSLTVYGTLNALGERNDDPGSSSWNPVVFTSLEDDNIGNPFDTNGNGTTTFPAAGDWEGIRIATGGTANLYGTIVRYAETGIHNDGGTLIVASSTVAFNDVHGIYNESGTTEAYSVDLGLQDYGLYVDGGTASITASSTIHDNALYGIYNDTLSTIDAENNYWATSTGPSALVGSAVYGPVDHNPYIPQLYYVRPGCPSSNCASVIDGELFYTASTTYGSELADAVNVWNGENKTQLSATSSLSNANLEIFDERLDDVAFKGGWTPVPDGVNIVPDSLLLNSYYLDSDPVSERQHTIEHELGHALGLIHSYTGNIMYYNQTNQTQLGPQDLRDYHYLWP